jgi:hypothetical protein
MNDFTQAYRLVRIAGGGVVAFLLGLVLIITGDLQSIVAGSGAIVAAVVLFGFLIWTFAAAKPMHTSPDAAESSMLDNSTRVIWLGLGLTLVPGLLYFYLRFAMSRFDPKAVVFVSVPLLISGLGCMGKGLWSLIQGEDKTSH